MNRPSGLSGLGGVKGEEVMGPIGVAIGYPTHVTEVYEYK